MSLPGGNSSKLARFTVSLSVWTGLTVSDPSTGEKRLTGDGSPEELPPRTPSDAAPRVRMSRRRGDKGFSVNHPLCADASRTRNLEGADASDGDRAVGERDRTTAPAPTEEVASRRKSDRDTGECVPEPTGWVAFCRKGERVATGDTEREANVNPLPSANLFSGSVTSFGALRESLGPDQLDMRASQLGCELEAED